MLAESSPQPHVDFTPILHGLTAMALHLWPLWVVLAIAGTIRIALDVYEERRLVRSGIEEIDEMDGPAFERRLALLFRDLGYRVRLTQKGADFGADLLLKKGGRKIAVQAKRWSKRVSLDAVQEVNGAVGYYGCDVGLVVTNSYFTGPARELASSVEVKLWDRDELVRKLLEADVRRGSAPLLET